MSTEERIRLVFIPQIKPVGVTSERSPKMLEMLTRLYDVQGVPAGRLNAFVFDQGKGKLARYLLFPVDIALNTWRTLRALRESGGEVVFAEGSYFSFAAGLAARLRRTPLIWDNHGHIVTFAQVQGKSSFFTRGNVLFERMLEALSSKVLVVNERDKADYIALGFRPDKLVVVPTCADMGAVHRGMRPREEAKRQLGISLESKVVLFVGTLKYGPNVEAASYLGDILPRVRQNHPETKVYVAGSGPAPSAPPEGMTYLGFVDDLYLWLSASDVGVAPMWRGLGILTKVIDSMSATRATVVSPLALDGIPELAHGNNCMVGADREDFERQLSLLLEDEELRERIAGSGRDLISRRYSCEVVQSSLSQLVSSLVRK